MIKDLRLLQSWRQYEALGLPNIYCWHCCKHCCKCKAQKYLFQTAPTAHTDTRLTVLERNNFMNLACTLMVNLMRGRLPNCVSLRAKAAVTNTNCRRCNFRVRRPLHLPPHNPVALMADKRVLKSKGLVAKRS